MALINLSITIINQQFAEDIIYRTIPSYFYPSTKHLLEDDLETNVVNTDADKPRVCKRQLVAWFGLEVINTVTEPIKAAPDLTVVTKEEIDEGYDVEDKEETNKDEFGILASSVLLLGWRDKPIKVLKWRK